MHLKYSKGSKQSTHLYMALQAVDPNSLMISTSWELHCGQATSFSGGAIPAFFIFLRAFLSIHSVVHGGERTVFN